MNISIKPGDTIWYEMPDGRWVALGTIPAKAVEISTSVQEISGAKR